MCLGQLRASDFRGAFVRTCARQQVTATSGGDFSQHMKNKVNIRRQLLTAKRAAQIAVESEEETSGGSHVEADANEFTAGGINTDSNDPAATNNIPPVRIPVVSARGTIVPGQFELAPRYLDVDDTV